MAKVIWSHDAVGDLQQIFRYLEQGSPIYAERFVSEIHNRVLILEDHPRIGRAVPEWRHSDFREILYYPYRIIYEIRGESIIIHAIVHGARPLHLA